LIEKLLVTSNLSRFSKSQQIEIDGLLNDQECSDEIKYILSCRFEERMGEKIIYKYIKNVNKKLEKTIEIKFEYLVRKYLSDPKDLVTLQEIKQAYSKIFFYEERHYYSLNQNNPTKMPYEIAKQIMSECKDYPRIISSLAEKTCRVNANKNLKLIGEIAHAEKWFV